MDQENTASNLPAEQELYTNDVIREMVRLGMAKPKDCPQELWVNRDDINMRHESILELVLLGWQQTKIAKTLSISVFDVSRIINSELFQSSLAEARKVRTQEITKAVLHKLYMPAINVVETILNNDKEKSSVRLEAAKYAIDQSVGKAEQKVQTTGNTIVEVLHRIEELKSRQAGPDIESVAKEVDPMESFVDEYIGGDFKVGVRGNSQEESR